MSKKLGFDYLLLDGGFAGMQGVYYGPMLAGKTGTAVPAQPYWWRLFRSMHYLDIGLFGECTTGWVGNTSNAKDEDKNYLWMFSLGTIWGSSALRDNPETLHKIHQLYNGLPRNGMPRLQPSNTDPVRRYARKFYAQHAVPEWIELKNLRMGEPLEISVAIGRAPISGEDSLADTDVGETTQRTIRPWVWDDVVWHYSDGTSVVYPAYDQIDWNAE